jgi:exodeoxyribonuclease-1
MVAPLGTLKGVDTARIALDPDRCLEHARRLLPELEHIAPKVAEVFSRPYAGTGPDSADGSDPDRMIYSGGFFSSGDKHLMKKILEVPPDELASHIWSFQDSRLPLMLFRYRARNYPDTLNAEEAAAWDRDRARRLVETGDPAYFTLQDFKQAVEELRRARAEDSGALKILDQLEAWVLETGLERL